MTSQADGRGKYWWLWPVFNVEKDARDAARMGVIACGLIALVTGVMFYYGYIKNGDIYQLFGGIVIFAIYSLFGFGILKMSRMAASLALILFIVEKGYSYFFERKPLGIAIILGLYLIHSARATYWFHEEMRKPTIEVSNENH